MAVTRNWRKRNETKRRESRSTTKIKITEQYKKIEIISRCDARFSEILTQIFGKNEPTEKTVEKERIMELGRRTAEGIQPNKTDADLETMFSALCKRQG